MLLRGTLSKNWVAVLKKVTDAYNNTPLQRLGWLKPNQITSEASSALVDRAKHQNNIAILKEPTFQEQNLNKEEIQDLKVDDYVYKDFEFKLFDKSFDVSVTKF